MCSTYIPIMPTTPNVKPINMISQTRAGNYRRSRYVGPSRAFCRGKISNFQKHQTCCFKRKKKKKKKKKIILVNSSFTPGVKSEGKTTYPYSSAHMHPPSRSLGVKRIRSRYRDISRSTKEKKKNFAGPGKKIFFFFETG